MGNYTIRIIYRGAGGRVKEKIWGKTSNTKCHLKNDIETDCCI